MKFSLLPFFLCFVFHLSTAQVPQRETRPRTASISGRVTIGGRPAVNASVSVEEFNRGSEGGAKVLAGAVVQPRIFAKARTDGEGRYRFTGLAEGQYSMRALSRAFISKADQDEESSARQVTLDDGEARENIDFTFVRGGVITGRVTDAEGRPLIATGIQLLPVNEKGEPQNQPQFDLWDILETDDRGVYRLYGLRAGRYIIGAGGERWGGQTGRLPITFHPEATDRKQSKIIEVKEGEVVENIDIRVGVARKTYEAIGRVIDAETGQPIPATRLFCESVRENAESTDSIGRDTVTDEQGRFKLAGLIAGQYALRLGNYWSESAEHYSEPTRFAVNDGDVSGLELKAVRGAAVSGTIVVAGAADPAVKAKLQQTMLYVSVMTAREGVADGNPYNHQGGGTAKVDANGGFRVSGLPPGKLMFHLRGYGRSPFTIDRMERDGARVDRALEIGRGERIDNVRIVVEHANGSIRGQIKIAGGALPQGWRLHVNASRASAAEGSEELRPFQTEGGYGWVDDKGRFSIERLAPGKYDVIVTVTARSGPQGNEESVEVESIKQRVAVTNSAETPVTIAFDPARKQKERQ